MHIPVESAPPEFMARYQAVMRGDEKLDTVQKLKAFWLFGIEQGWSHPEMREHIAKLMVEALDMNRGSFPAELYPSVWRVALDIESATVIGDPMAKELDKELYDKCWSETLWFIDKLLVDS